MKFTVLPFILAAACGLAELRLSVEGDVALETARSLGEPSLQYTLERADNLVSNDWNPVAVYSGDGSPFGMDTAGFSLSTQFDGSVTEEMIFAGTGAPDDQAFYRLTTETVAVPVEYYADEYDFSYVRIRSLDGDKLLIHNPGASTVEYATGLDLSDIRAHWVVRYSLQGNRYWLTNRQTGESIHVEQQTGGSSGRTVLIDFGTDSTYRGASVSSPDVNGNHWNGIGYSAVNNMVDISSNTTPFDLAMTSSFGTDSFNGPGGVFDAVALGSLGVSNAVDDFFAGDETLELRDLDPSRDYTLTFFGSKKYPDENITVYALTDSNGTVQASVSLTIGAGSAHNTSNTAVLSNVSPEPDGTIYLAFVGQTGNSGYLNAMQVVEESNISSGTGSLQTGVLKPTFTSYRWKFYSEPGFYRIESGWKSNEYFSVDDAASGTALYAPLDTADDAQKFVLDPLLNGALVPWTAYDEDNLDALGSGATILEPTYDRLLVQSEAQKRSCVLLGSEGDSVRWALTDSADAFTLRYAIEDAPSGGGANGTVTLEIRDGGGALVETTALPVTSEQAWVYFDTSMVESNLPSHGRPAKRFNEVRVKTAAPLQSGYTLELRRESGEPQIWIDTVETETVPAPVTVNPADYYNVLDYGATTNDAIDDWSAFNNCINAAEAAGKGVYIPAGVYELSTKLFVGGITVQGAGMWHTELHFITADTGVNDSGFWGDDSNTTVRDLYMRTSSTMRGGAGNAFRQYWGTNSLIENVWAEQFGAAFWIADYIPPYDLTDGLMVRNCRVRNGFADGLNFARGTKNSVVENCHFRGTGDDAVATWSSTTDLPQCVNNAFRYNTMECNYRAAGAGVFGGEGHRIHHNLIQDAVGGPAIRFNTVFSGYDFSTNDTMAAYRNTLLRNGTLGGYGTSPAEYGAINLITRYGDVQNILIEDTLIDDVMNCGIYISHSTDGTGGVITNVTLRNVRMANVPIGTSVRSAATGEAEYDGVNVTLDPQRGEDVLQNDSSNFSITGQINGRREFEDYSAYSDTTPGNTGGQYRADDVDIGDSGVGGYSIGWIAAGEWLDFPLTNNREGVFLLTVSTASGFDGGTMRMLIDGTEAATLELPATGGWTAWTNVSTQISLPAGASTLRFDMVTDGYNLDWFSLE